MHVVSGKSGAWCKYKDSVRSDHVHATRHANRQLSIAQSDMGLLLDPSPDQYVVVVVVRSSSSRRE